MPTRLLLNWTMTALTTATTTIAALRGCRGRPRPRRPRRTLPRLLPRGRRWTGDRGRGQRRRSRRPRRPRPRTAAAWNSLQKQKVLTFPYMKHAYMELQNYLLNIFYPLSGVAAKSEGTPARQQYGLSGRVSPSSHTNRFSSSSSKIEIETQAKIIKERKGLLVFPLCSGPPFLNPFFFFVSSIHQWGKRKGGQEVCFKKGSLFQPPRRKWCSFLYTFTCLLSPLLTYFLLRPSFFLKNQLHPVIVHC